MLAQSCSCLRTPRFFDCHDLLPTGLCKIYCWGRKRVIPCIIIPWKVDIADLPKALKLLTHFIGPEIAPFSYSLQKCSISCEKSVREPDLYLASRGRFLTSSDTLCRDLSLYPRDMAGDSGPGRRYHACLLCEVAADIQPTASRRLLVYEASSSLQIQVYLHIQAKIEC